MDREQAFRRHEIVHVFDDPGSADLTANVDFAYMKEALAGVGKPISHLHRNIILTFLSIDSHTARANQPTILPHIARPRTASR
jgi:hypothetical protein